MDKPRRRCIGCAVVNSPDGETLVTAAKDGTLKVWNLDYTRRELKKISPDLAW